MELAQRIDELWESGELDPEPIEEAIALLDRGEARVAEKRDGEWAVNEWAKKAILLYFRLRKVRADGRRRPSLPRQDPGEGRLRRARCSRRAAGGRALRLLPVRGRRAHARLREHRSLGRAEDDGRYVGDGRIVRPDRRGRPPRRRCGHRRRAGAAAGSSRHRRGRRLSRLARRRRRRSGRREGGRHRAQRRPRGFDSDHRRHRARSRSSTAATCRLARSSCPARGRRSTPPGATSFPAR